MCICIVHSVYVTSKSVELRYSRQNRRKFISIFRIACLANSFSNGLFPMFVNGVDLHGNNFKIFPHNNPVTVVRKFMVILCTSGVLKRQKFLLNSVAVQCFLGFSNRTLWKVSISWDGFIKTLKYEVMFPSMNVMEIIGFVCRFFRDINCFLMQFNLHLVLPSGRRQSTQY
jgi:hypothetical protein